jgi:hypothetical protein
MLGKGAMISGAMFVVMLMLLGVFAIPSPASAAPATLNSKLTTATGTTTDFGGGNYFYVKFGTDAAFGIVWGNDQTANNVYFVAIKARYIGVAQVYDSQGAVVAANHTIKIYTVYAVKLDDILEFNDSNQNGLLQAHRVYQYGNFTGTYVHSEQMFKEVNLKTAWAQSPVTYKETSNQKTWSFDLAAKDLPYVPLDNYSGPAGDNKLNNLTLTFHLSANMVQVDNATMPQWRITVQRGGMMGGGMMGGGTTDGMTMMGTPEAMPDLVVSGKMLRYHVKWDQSIQGWDFDANNANPSLLVEFSAIVANYIPRELMVAWMQMSSIGQMNEDGQSTMMTSTGGMGVDGNTGMMSTPRMLSSPMMTFGGDRTRIGAFEWVSNVTVDGNNEQLHSQIMGGVPFWMFRSGGMIGGFAVLGGISYPGGEMIVHDPTFSSDALVDVGNKGTSSIPTALFGIALIVVTVVIVTVVLLVVMGGKKPKQRAPQTYERTLSSQPGEWTKYYQKKQ